MATTKLRRAGGGRITAFAACLAASALALTGCSGGSAASLGTVPASGAAIGGELNILVSSASGSDAGFKAINAAFSTKYPDVKVNFTSVPNENYNQTRTSRLTAGTIDIGLANPVELPDYVPASNMGDDARLADAGGFADLTGQPFMSKFIPSVLEKQKYKGKNYTVPTGLSYYSGMTYNKKIFADNNIKVPTTWDEFVKVCQDLKAKGVTPISLGGKDTAGLVMLGVVQSVYPSTKEKQDLARGLYGFSVKLNEGKQLEVLSKVQQIYTFAQDNFAGSSYAQMTSEFLTGKAAMISDGTWNVGSLREANKVDFGYFPLPASNNAADNASLGGKVEISLAIPANAKNRPAALAWMQTFSDEYASFNAKAGFAPSQEGVKGDEFYTGIASYTKNFEPAWDTIWIPSPKAGPAAKRPFNWEAVKPMGSLDAQGAAADAEKDWQAGK